MPGVQQPAPVVNADAAAGAEPITTTPELGETGQAVPGRQQPAPVVNADAAAGAEPITTTPELGETGQALQL